MDSHANNVSSSLSRLHAGVLLTVFLAMATGFVWLTLSPLANHMIEVDRPSDLDLYRAEVARMRAGESYYQAAEAELTPRGYPTRSVFNWRTPLPVWLIAALPRLTAQAVLVGLGLALVGLGFGLVFDEDGKYAALVAALLLSGALSLCLLEKPVYSSEVWCGILLALSAICLVRGRTAAGVAAGLAALFFRELAAPYVLLCVARGARRRNWREVAGWTGGLAAYAVFYGIHLTQVLPRIHETAVTQQGSWVQFGGLSFLISTVQMNGILLLMPQWVAALYLACAILGAATWNSPAGRLIGFTLALYIVAFGIVGYDYNLYWGSTIAPLLCLPAARAPGVLRQLWQVVSDSSSIAQPAG